MIPYYYDLGYYILTLTWLESSLSRNETADHLASQLTEIRYKVIDNIKAAAAWQERYTNSNHQEAEFKVGQEVLVDQHYINLANYP